MKLKINPYIFTLIKENSVYIAADILLIILTGFIAYLSVARSIQNKQKAESVSIEIKSLQNKLSFLNSALSSNEDLNADLQLLNALIPETEDYFSIIYALDELSQKTGFMITSYTVNLKQSNTNKLSLTITGVGNSTAFMKFLQNYNFGGGRLITSDKIELTPQMSDSIKINVAFYNKKTSSGQNTSSAFSNKSLTELTALRNKLQFSLKSGSSEAELDFSYPRKSNPF